MELAIAAILEAKSGVADELEATLTALVEHTRREPGNLHYELFRSVEGNRFLMFERYADQAAHAAHRDTEHYRTYAPQIVDYLARPFEAYFLSQDPPTANDAGADS